MVESYCEILKPKSFVQSERISQFFEMKTFAREISQSVFICFFLKYTVIFAFLFHLLNYGMTCNTKLQGFRHTKPTNHLVRDAYA